MNMEWMRHSLTRYAPYFNFTFGILILPLLVGLGRLLATESWRGDPDARLLGEVERWKAFGVFE